MLSLFNGFRYILERLIESAQSGQDASQVCEKIIEYHHSQMIELKVQPTTVEPYFEDLRRLTFGATSIQEVSPKIVGTDFVRRRDTVHTHR